MQILVIHSVRFETMQYHISIDHARHGVIYLGTHEQLADTPSDLPCKMHMFGADEDLLHAASDAVSCMGPLPDRIISVHERELIYAAFGIPDPKPDDVLPLRDKVVMKQRVSTAGLPTPRLAELSHFLAGDDQ